MESSAAGPDWLIVKGWRWYRGVVWGGGIEEVKIGIDVASVKNCHEGKGNKTNAGARAAGRGNDNEWNRQKEVD